VQDYSTRKVLERTVKGVTHDKAAISVAPPKQYARRFLDFATRQVFMSEHEYHSSLQQYGCSADQAGSLAGVLQQQQQEQQQLAPGALQSPWAMHLADQGSAINTASADQQQPMQQLEQASQQQQQQQEQLPRLAQNGSFGPQMPLVTEDSFPLPPGQLGSEGSGSTLAASGPAAAAGVTAAAAAGGGVGVVLQRGAAAASPVLPGEQSMLLELLAAPTGMIQLTSGGNSNGPADAAAAAAAGVDAAGGGAGKHGAAAAAAAALGQQLSEEQVQVRLESLGSYDCPAAAAVSNNGQQQQQQLAGQTPAAVAAGEHGDGVLVPAVVVELQGVADRAPASKQGSLERQADVPAALAGVNGMKGVNGHVVVVNGVGHSS
jgi:hypothetical protein